MGQQGPCPALDRVGLELHCTTVAFQHHLHTASSRPITQLTHRPGLPLLLPSWDHSFCLPLCHLATLCACPTRHMLLTLLHCLVHHFACYHDCHDCHTTQSYCHDCHRFAPLQPHLTPLAQVPVLVLMYSVNTLGRCSLTVYWVYCPRSLSCHSFTAGHYPWSLGRSSSTAVHYVSCTSCPFCCRYPLWSLAVRLLPRCYLRPRAAAPLDHCHCSLSGYGLCSPSSTHAVSCAFMYCQQPLGRCSADVYMMRFSQQQRPLRCNCFVAPKGRPAFSAWEAPLRCPSWPTLTTLSS